MHNTGKTILVVDDYELIVERLTALLEELAYVAQVWSARSYTESVALLGTQVPDIALLDIHLPDRSGIDLLDYIKDRYPAVRVIMISNQVNPTYKVLCQEKGADFVIDKSNDYEMIPNLIASLSGCS
ncbi:response regulator [Dinghuibacter silviterrae]|uniref:Response regulator receiver domain-containing protein n=1 Tax=Dinghuibacter silviterrae TaxID=1539049 RepID=A0A4R8DUC7_9BACT|nr:response regulator [Dinghuibacter silviterrae]TDX01970.1 response regulator receiver domain-containing protein [Dinghuibacter silviterrae]